MTNPVRITFHGIAPSEPVRAAVEAHAAKLEDRFGGVVRCDVALEAPHHHKRHGTAYRVRIDLVVGGRELVVARAPSDDPKQQDLYAAVDDAFDDAARMLQDHARRLRGDVKTHEPSRHARVSKLFSYEGYGFLEADDGAEVYFHKNAVLHHGFDRLAIGARVRFVEEMGNEGPQASTVALVR